MVNYNRVSFSAAKIQDYLDCERRYELKYILNQSWPAVSSEPVLENEENIRKGNKFHFLVHQYFSGISGTTLLDSIHEEDISNWFKSFLEFSNSLQIKRSFSEFPINYQMDGIRFFAVFDLIYTTHNEKIGIIDWKTSHFIPRKSTLGLKVQTILYPYLLNETFMEFFPNIDLLPENISMRYWYPSSPEKDFVFNYGQSTHENNHIFLENTIDEILSKKAGDFILTSDENKCGFCNYRSLCDRGVGAANLLELEDKDLGDNGLSIDFDQLPEFKLND